MKNFILKNKKILLIISVIVLIAICVVLAVNIFKNAMSQPYAGGGIYYSQNDSGEYLQFFKDKTFSHIYDASVSDSESTNNQVEILGKGTWEKKDGKIILKFPDTDNTISFGEKDGYLYREDTVFRGITSDALLLKNKYVYKQDENQRTQVYFLSDGTMTYAKFWGDSQKSRWGTYKRVGDILVVRYDDDAEIAHRFLVLDNGVSEDVYSKNKVK